MCDYSLAQFPNRLARKGEELVVYRFVSQTIGLTDSRRNWREVLFPATVPAVCVPPGAKLLLCDIPMQLQQDLEVGPVEEVTFTQKTAESFIYRDAVRFKNGVEVLIQSLKRGQRVRILSLGNDVLEDDSKYETSVVAIQR